MGSPDHVKSALVIKDGWIAREILSGPGRWGENGLVVVQCFELLAVFARREKDSRFSVVAEVGKKHDIFFNLSRNSEVHEGGDKDRCDGFDVHGNR